MKTLTGRQYEIAQLNAIYNSNSSEFVAVYGRRRVGKTFLIRNVYENMFSFQVTGLANPTKNQQLANFNMALREANPSVIEPPAMTWLDAFSQLRKILEKQTSKRKIVFIDELPWFDTRNSGFIQALEHFWNNWAFIRNDIVLIVCGSATSWMINKLINNKGGLHNRITKKIKLQPFNLYECEQFLLNRKIKLDRYQIVQVYMALGGIPYYWDNIEKGQSAQQNIERMLFNESGLLSEEFNNLYRSLFLQHEKYILIVKQLATKSKGLTREEILSLSKLPNAGSTTRMLEELELSGFIRKYVPFGKIKRESVYQLVDFYSLFFLKFLHNKSKTITPQQPTVLSSPSYISWSGYAFELVWLLHIDQLKKALGILGVQTEIYSWNNKKAGMGNQIDLLINRKDHVINLCEAKYSISPFVITKKYAIELRNKAGNFISDTGTKKTIAITMLTTFGIRPNENSIGLIQNEICMDVLFCQL